MLVGANTPPEPGVALGLMVWASLLNQPWSGISRNRWARREALQRHREFIIAYTRARKTWREDATVKFPRGTYWLRRFASVPVAET